MRIYMQNPSANQKPTRFYHLLLQKDLIDGWNLLVESGEQGRAGRLRREHFANRELAMDKLMLLRDSQIERGYRVMYVQGQSQSVPSGDVGNG